MIGSLADPGAVSGTGRPSSGLRPRFSRRTAKMKSACLAFAATAVLALSVTGCSQERKAEADTGTAKATVTTDAPPAAVPDSQLQQQAQQAATASSTPVDGSGPVATTSAAAPAAPGSAAP